MNFNYGNRLIGQSMLVVNNDYGFKSVNASVYEIHSIQYRENNKRSLLWDFTDADGRSLDWGCR
jgi:hypothetical protein